MNIQTLINNLKAEITKMTDADPTPENKGYIKQLTEDLEMLQESLELYNMND